VEKEKGEKQKEKKEREAWLAGSIFLIDV